MTKGEILKRIATIGREISLLFGELSAELSETDSRAWLRFVKNEPRCGSSQNNTLRTRERLTEFSARRSLWRAKLQ